MLRSRGKSQENSYYELHGALWTARLHNLHVSMAKWLLRHCLAGPPPPRLLDKNDASVCKAVAGIVVLIRNNQLRFGRKMTDFDVNP